MVWQVVQRVSVPVIGIGGIMTAEDALEFLILGAKAVQIGTANFINPHATIDILEGIKNYLQSNKIKDINQIIGTFQP
jgi:dihydroorotate dehydrogenase (NAD+) catalytic subunit